MNEIISWVIETVQSVDPWLRITLAGLAIMLETSLFVGLVIPGDTVVIVASTAVENMVDFGFLLGALSMFLSAILTGGLGPWVAYQSFAAGWIGLGIALIPRSLRGRYEIAALALYGVLASEFFGIAMDLQFWPWVLGADTQLSYLAGAPINENLSRFFSYHFLSAMAWDIPRAVFTASLITIAGKPILHTLRRDRKSVV